MIELRSRAKTRSRSDSEVSTGNYSRLSEDELLLQESDDEFAPLFAPKESISKQSIEAKYGKKFVKQEPSKLANVCIYFSSIAIVFLFTIWILLYIESPFIKVEDEEYSKREMASSVLGAIGMYGVALSVSIYLVWKAS